MEKDKWDDCYRSSDPEKEPAPLLANYAPLLAGGKALDIAMGRGHNAFFLAAHGYAVEGIDISSVAVTQVNTIAEKNRLSVRAVEADLTQYVIPANSYNLIINFYYLERDLIPRIKNGLTQGGLIFFETYTVAQSQFGPPSNPDYLLNPNELLIAFLDFFIIFYHERIVQDKTGSKAIASLIAQKV